MRLHESDLEAKEIAAFVTAPSQSSSISISFDQIGAMGFEEIEYRVSVVVSHAL